MFGTVTDSATGEPLPYVKVGVDGSLNATATADDGTYRLTLTAGAPLTLRFSHTGYRPQEVKVTVWNLQGQEVNARLVPQATQLGAVTITEEGPRPTAFTHIGVEKLADAVGPQGGVEGVLKTLPDVQSGNELSSQYSVRGGSFDENLVYINGIEVFRPMLIRNGKQEGMSIINPDLVDYILFSPGGFDAVYGDKLSSVLDITYSRPSEFKGQASVSLLGGSASVQGRAGERWGYAAGARLHSNRYVLGSLDTRGAYSTSYADLQGLVHYKASPKLDLGMLLLLTRNVYGLVPESQITAFAGRTMELDVYFDGQEQDKYRTLLSALTFDYRPRREWRVGGNLSVQRIRESENYDIQSEYWLYQLGLAEQVGEVERFDRGVGTFLEHARNRMLTTIVSAEAKATHDVRMGQWQMGAKVQYERVTDRLREWRLTDSAGYAYPSHMPPAGNAGNEPVAPVLGQYVNADGGLHTLRATAFAQREVDWTLDDGGELKLMAGLRGGLYATQLEWYGETQGTGLHATFSPRVSVSFKPHMAQDLLLRLATGLYTQPPFYREYRYPDGTLEASVSPQRSYQVMGTADWNFRLWEKPFKLTADVYYKYIPNLVPYTVDNLRISYSPDLNARAYAAGVSLRVNGEFVEGLESWLSASLMHTQEDIEGDGLSWLDRPTDQRFSIKLFLQDNIPDIPWWRMSLSMIFATGVPISSPYSDRTDALRMPRYLRVDWGNSVQLSRFDSMKRWIVKAHLNEVQVGVEVFNLFNFRNVESYLWVTDYEQTPYRVPNYLTARQLNVKLTVLF